MMRVENSTGSCPQRWPELGLPPGLSTGCLHSSSSIWLLRTDHVPGPPTRRKTGGGGGEQLSLKTLE